MHKIMLVDASGLKSKIFNLSLGKSILIKNNFIFLIEMIGLMKFYNKNL